MPTVIDSLLVKIGLDPSGFTKGQKEAAAAVVKQKAEAEKWRKASESDAKKVTEAFVKFKREVVAVATAFFGLHAAARFTGNLVTTGAEVAKLSSLLGISVDHLSLWEHAAGKLGATSGEMASTFEQVVRMASELRELGSTPGLEGDSPLVRAGLDMAKFADQSTSAEERVFMLSEALAKLRPETALLWGQQLGFSNSIIYLLRQGPEAIRRTLEEQKRLNYETAAQARALLKMQQDWARFVDVIENAGKRILLAIEPTLLRLARQFENWLVRAGGIEKIVKNVKDFAAWLDRIDWKRVGDGIDKIMQALEPLGDMLAKILGTPGAKYLLGFAAGSVVGGPLGGLFLASALAGSDIGDWLDEKLGSSDTARKLRTQPGYKGSAAEWLFGQPPLVMAVERARNANPPIMPTAATIKAPPGTPAPGAGVNTVTIGNVNIYTHATDAAGMARGAKTALTRELSTVTQAGGGGQ